MFAMFKLCAILALAAPFASALTITTISGNTVSEGTITINWVTAADDAAGVFSIELNHPSFNNALAIGSNVDASFGTTTINLPNVPVADGYTIEFVDISNINSVFASSSPFSIGAVSQTLSTTISNKSTAKPTTKSNTSKPVSTSQGSVTSPSSGSSTGGFGVTKSNDASNTGSSAPAQSSGPGTGGAASLVISAPAVALVAGGLLAGIFAL
jgi:hypothetical protein